ncbi:MAG TPA: DUF4384 domain-containing protein, partial [Pyrinomonadaceae bacterium]|nr:DUF4384 domain-containing protein [Pyrinomonadaceae bacterium]
MRNSQMCLKFLAAAALLALVCGASATARQQGQDEQKVVEDFVGSRGVSFDEPAASTAAEKPKPRPTPRPTPRPQKQTGAGKAGTASAKTKKAGAGQSSTSGSQTAAGPSIIQQAGGPASSGAGGARPVGLGYTIYMKDRLGGLSVAEPTRQFKSGDAIAIALETNTDGYLYVFNAEDGRDPVMLFPHVLLDGGSNRVSAHERVTYPADVNYSFEFDDRPATEHLYIVVSRRPLEGVPSGEALAAYCGARREDCYWRPTPEQWEKIKAGATGPRVKEAKSVLVADAQKPLRPAALTRGIKIKKSEPAPSVVRVNDSADSDVLVTRIELAHR